ncbi:MAG: hypothetical protein HZB86_01360 [Deltaproteobacteria bacterium]|nr:hypothetical protein [Deltaproteobacteria bacterium]
MPYRNHPRFNLRRLLRFPLLSAKGRPSAAGTTESEVLFELTGENPENRLFGRYDAAEVRERLERAGLLPGLGLLSELFALLSAFSRELSVDGVLDVPDHFHTALFYSRAFRYLDPAEEGRFQAIARDLAAVPIALASDAIREGCLFDRGTGAPLPWVASEQVMSGRGPLRRFLRSEAYRTARNRALADLHVVVNWDLYRRKIASRGAGEKSP